LSSKKKICEVCCIFLWFWSFVRQRYSYANLLRSPSYLQQFLGINTPLWHFKSNSPNGCVPNIYWRGSLLSLRLQSLNSWRYCDFTGVVEVGCVSRTCSTSHRNSDLALGRSRHPRRTRGRRGESLYALRSVLCGMRGIVSCVVGRLF